MRIPDFTLHQPLTTEEAVGHFEESCGDLWRFRHKFSFRSHIVELVEHGLTRNNDIRENKTAA